MNIGQVYESNGFGAFKIVDYHNARNVEVQFLNTGYKAVAEAGNIRRGRVKDCLVPNVYGAGYLGKGLHKAWVDGKDSKVYKIWHGMLERAYCPKFQAKNPTYVGVTVCDEWRNFQVFAEWFFNASNFVEGLHLDKDIIKKGNRVYCPEYCKFVTLAENNVEAQAKYYEFISPSSVLIKIYNMCEFCREHGLSQGNMSNVHLGKRPHHKGWRSAANRYAEHVNVV